MSHPYQADISIIITNLYEDSNIYPYQIYNRKKLIDLIVNEKSINFKIYGSPHLQIKYPHHYGGSVSYTDLPKIIGSSKINITTHVDGRYLYLNERSFIIPACAGLMYIDPIPNLDQYFIPGVECIVMDINDPISQIKEILSNYDNYEKIKEAGYEKFKNNYTLNHWINFFESNIK